MTRYPFNVRSKYEWIKKMFEHAKQGGILTMERGGHTYDLPALQEWFRQQLDEAINLKAGLRADGAPRKRQCACKHCVGRCDCNIRKLSARGSFVCGYGCREPWGGRRWDPDWQRALSQDARAIQDKIERRVAIHNFRTDIVRSKLGHLVTRSDEE